MSGRTATPQPPIRARDYYDPEWGRLVEGRGLDTNDELWARNVPIMRAFGAAVLVLALALGYPRADPDGWRGPVTVALVGALAVAFAIMWIRRRIWDYSVRTLAIHGAFQVAAYCALVSVSPPFAVLLLIVYPQVVFSLPVRWAVAAGLFVGTFTGIVAVAYASPDPVAGLPWFVASVLGAVLVVAMAVWIRLTISQSLERQTLIGQLAAAREQLAAAARDAAIAEERARVAREIHDTLAQGFASVITHLEAADARLETDPDVARRDMRAAEDAARSSLAEARTLIWSLRPEALAAAGLPAAIERVSRTAAGPGFAVEFELSGPARRLHPDVEVTLLRAAQEALANARRHAGASRVTVTLTYFDDEVSLDVADDGRGFDTSSAGRSGGLGLVGMRERAVQLGGSVEIESAPGEGAVVAVRVPAIEPPSAAAGAGAARETAPTPIDPPAAATDPPAADPTRSEAPAVAGAATTATEPTGAAR